MAGRARLPPAGPLRTTRQRRDDMPTLMPGDLTRLIFSGFAGAGIGDVANYLYRTEPRYMAALEADIRERCITQAVELPRRCLLVPGPHPAPSARPASA